MDQQWQDKTDDTLKRIEAQADDTEHQEGFALNFREIVLTRLERIQAAIEIHCTDNKKDIAAIQKSLDNHLHTHDKIMTHIVYPVAVLVVIAILGAFFKLVLHVF